VDTQAELPPQAVAAMRSILREAVGNALRHAEATTVGIRLGDVASGLVLMVADDGNGFDPETAPAGNGLRNMRSRATALHGHDDGFAGRCHGDARNGDRGSLSARRRRGVKSVADPRRCIGNAAVAGRDRGRGVSGLRGDGCLHRARCAGRNGPARV
jgi:hypothetical protein